MVQTNGSGALYCKFTVFGTKEAGLLNNQCSALKRIWRIYEENKQDWDNYL
jgi:hypothetical protein